MPEEDGNLMKGTCQRTSEQVEGRQHRLHCESIASQLAKSFANRCTISLVSSGPQLIRPPARAERNWLPVVVASVIVIAVVGALFFFYEHRKGGPTVTPISAAVDPYAANLTIDNLALSESSNLSGGKVTYLDGHIANKGSRTVTGITVQVLFRDAAHEVAQNETQALQDHPHARSICRRRAALGGSAQARRYRRLPPGVRYRRGPMGRRLP